MDHLNGQPLTKSWIWPCILIGCKQNKFPLILSSGLFVMLGIVWLFQLRFQENSSGVPDKSGTTAVVGEFKGGGGVKQRLQDSLCTRGFWLWPTKLTYLPRMQGNTGDSGPPLCTRGFWLWPILIDLLSQRTGRQRANTFVNLVVTHLTWPASRRDLLKLTYFSLWPTYVDLLTHNPGARRARLRPWHSSVSPWSGNGTPLPLAAEMSENCSEQPCLEAVRTKTVWRPLSRLTLTGISLGSSRGGPAQPPWRWRRQDSIRLSRLRRARPKKAIKAECQT